ncbi:Copia protein [Trachymyrmex zeteki]|uniref:Copia protein n=1 Tax=Mycetomoellerius zeteki TaxID=64791 RepID=A0A151WJ84_9HYME|nr:Copia protein [Trachymyrmex zeteki]
MARCLLTQSKLPISFWAEAVNTANYIRNRCITKALKGKTPFELWHKKRPSVKHMRIFGEVTHVLNKAPNKGKLDPQGIRYIFLGYDESSKGYRVWIPNKQKAIVSRDVKFFNTIKIDGQPTILMKN